MAGPLKAKFWGVRGSVPSPLTAVDLEKKAKTLLKRYKEYGCPDDTDNFAEMQKDCGLVGPGLTPYTYGGNTSCIEVTDDSGTRIVLDMGTGLRPLGNALFKEMMSKRGLSITFLLSHIHWDHIHGLPFFGPLYVNKETGVKNHWSFYGGTNWQQTSEICLRGQMDPPNFPVSWDEIKKITTEIRCEDIHDLMQFKVGDIKVMCRKLNHPQETYGWRLEGADGSVIAYTTDNEPYDPNYPDPRLVQIAKNAKVWITDCQYSQDIYNGKVGGVPRHGWGHSYPEAVAATAVAANVERVVLFHHDPCASDEHIKELEQETHGLICSLMSSIPIGERFVIRPPLAAFEGLEL